MGPASRGIEEEEYIEGGYILKGGIYIGMGHGTVARRRGVSGASHRGPENSTHHIVQTI